MISIVFENSHASANCIHHFKNKVIHANNIIGEFINIPSHKLWLRLTFITYLKIYAISKNNKKNNKSILHESKQVYKWTHNIRKPGHIPIWYSCWPCSQIIGLGCYGFTYLKNLLDQQIIRKSLQAHLIPRSDIVKRFRRH